MIPCVNLNSLVLKKHIQIIYSGPALERTAFIFQWKRADVRFSEKKNIDCWFDKIYTFSYR